MKRDSAPVHTSDAPCSLNVFHFVLPRHVALLVLNAREHKIHFPTSHFRHHQRRPSRASKVHKYSSFRVRMDTSSLDDSLLSRFEVLSLHKATGVLIKSEKHAVQQSLVSVVRNLMHAVVCTKSLKAFRRSLCQKLERAAHISRKGGDQELATALLEQKVALERVILKCANTMCRVPS